MKLENYTERMLVISTGHLPEDVARELSVQPDDAQKIPVTIIPHDEYGWMFPLADLDSFTSDDVFDVPAELWRLLEFAHNEGFHWLLLDRDADSLPEEAGIPIYDW